MTQSALCRLVRSSALVTALRAPTVGLSSAQEPKADNTKVNTRDREKGAVTADQQKNDAARSAGDPENPSGADAGQNAVELRAQREDRRAAAAGHAQGTGALRRRESRAVEAKATEVVGAGHVVNQLSVAPAKSKSK